MWWEKVFTRQQRKKLTVRYDDVFCRLGPKQTNKCSQACTAISFTWFEHNANDSYSSKVKKCRAQKDNHATEFTQIPAVLQKKTCLVSLWGALRSQTKCSNQVTSYQRLTHTSSHANAAHPFSAQSAVNKKIRSKSCTWWCEGRLAAYLMASPGHSAIFFWSWVKQISTQFDISYHYIFDFS